MQKNSTAILISVILIVIAAVIVWYFAGTEATRNVDTQSTPVSGQLQGTVVPSTNG